MKIKILDELAPEDTAMLQALYSRSPASVDDHLAKLAASGSGPFMERYYVGYGHQSIGDCGTTTIFIEGVSMLAAKAIQDWPLYSGQESSTRYMDFSSAEFRNPIGSLLGEEIQSGWRQFYLDAQGPTLEHLRKKYPRREDEDETVYERALRARLFDTLRGFLPAGAVTNLSWHTNLRQAADHLAWLLVHPDYHVAAIANQIKFELKKRYPSSFPDSPRDRDDATWRMHLLDDHYFVRPLTLTVPGTGTSSFVGIRFTDFSGVKIPKDLHPWLANRPRGVPLPWFLGSLGHVRSQFPLDFGSFRDLQRHRNGTIRMPMLTTELGFHPWYLDELDQSLCIEAKKFLREQEWKLVRLACDPVQLQQYIAMGYQVPCEIHQSLPAFVYRIELRSSKTVHPTLRDEVLREIRDTRRDLPEVAIHVDEDPDGWTIRRGQQTIVEKTE